MDKTLRLALNKYSPIPPKLRASPKIDSARSELTVGLASLYHHYYLDSFGKAPPNPDPAQFEHAHFLLPCSEFRFQGSGLGISPAIKSHRSNELGQAFCRWFLYENLNVTYFAHLPQLLSRQLQRPFKGLSIQRSAPGDTPDYLCADVSGRVFLAEAKGRYAPISFKNKEFETWRKQFGRVTFKDAAGDERILKGHIVATRFATEADSARLRSTIWAEDPNSAGRQFLDSDSSPPFAQATIAAHFAGIVAKLRQPLLDQALASGVSLPDEIRILAIAWRVVAGPLQGRRFVGGYFAAEGRTAEFQKTEGGSLHSAVGPLRLDVPSFTFFGVEETIFRRVVDLARSPAAQNARDFPTFENTAFFYSGFSVLRDGSALGPLDFFSPEEQLVL
jgi:hypothetical protein